MKPLFLAVAVGIAGAASLAGAQSNAFLGAQMAPLTPEVQADLDIHVSKGAAIGDIIPNSPAEKAGLKQGDVIIRIDGKPIFWPQDVIAMVGRHSAGDRIAVEILDAGKDHRPRTVSVTLEPRPGGFAPAPQSSPRQQAPNASMPPKLANAGPRASNPIPTQPLRNAFCHALAPAGWMIVDQDDRGATFSVSSPDGNQIAAYGIVGIGSGQAAGYYGPQFRTPAAFAQFLASTVAGQPVQAMGIQPFNGMQVMNFGGARHGFVIYRTYPLPADPGGYIISARVAVGSSERDTPSSGAVAASIDCNTTFKAPPGGYTQVHAKPAETGISKRCKAGDCNDSDLAGTYNAQLGTGYVHSASGTNYLVDVTTDYHATGPDGPGYYRQVGNSLEKLEPGRSD